MRLSPSAVLAAVLACSPSFAPVESPRTSASASSSAPAVASSAVAPRPIPSAIQLAFEAMGAEILAKLNSEVGAGTLVDVISTRKVPLVKLRDALVGSVFSDALPHLRSGGWQLAQTSLEKKLASAEGGGAPLHHRLAATALVGRACARGGRPACAAAAFNAVVTSFEANRASIRPDGSAGHDAANWAVRAVNESLFELAEEERRMAEAVAPPKYVGTRSRSAASLFVKGELSLWFKRQLVGLERAEAAYKRIIRLGTHADPRWTIAAAERSASMWARFADAFVAAGRSSMPDEWSGTLVRLSYIGSMLEEHAHPVREKRARPAYLACVRESEKFGAVTGHTEFCVKWLADNPLKEGGAAGPSRP